MMTVRTIVIAKAPIAGFAKTRLIPALGAQGAAQLAQRMLVHTLGTALAAQLGPVELCVDPGPSDPVWQTLDLPSTLAWSTQGTGDLGQRMARAAQRAIDRQEQVLLVGTDCPAISVAVLQGAAQALHSHDAALLPTADGGYALLGLRRFSATLFDHMPWSTPQVYALTLQRCAQIGWQVQSLPILHDIDEPADLVWLPKAWGYAAPDTLLATPV